jgi:hypothetical protein
MVYHLAMSAYYKDPPEHMFQVYNNSPRARNKFHTQIPAYSAGTGAALWGQQHNVTTTTVKWDSVLKFKTPRVVIRLRLVPC